MSCELHGKHNYSQDKQQITATRLQFSSSLLLKGTVEQCGSHLPLSDAPRETSTVVLWGTSFHLFQVSSVASSLRGGFSKRFFHTYHLAEKALCPSAALKRLGPWSIGGGLMAIALRHPGGRSRRHYTPPHQTPAHHIHNLPFMWTPSGPFSSGKQHTQQPLPPSAHTFILAPDN